MAAAQGCALKSSFETLALSSAGVLATTSKKLLACLSCLWESCPIHVPATVIVNPPPFTRRGELWCANHHLAPTEASLQGSSLDVLSEGFLCWWDGIY